MHYHDELGLLLFSSVQHSVLKCNPEVLSLMLRMCTSSRTQNLKMCVFLQHLQGYGDGTESAFSDSLKITTLSVINCQFMK